MVKDVSVLLSPQDTYSVLVNQVEAQHGQFTFVGAGRSDIEHLIRHTPLGKDGYKIIKVSIDASPVDGYDIDLAAVSTVSTVRPIYELITEAQALLSKKAADYSSVEDEHSNFKYATLVAKPFDDTYKPYAVLIGVKLARLSVLMHEGKEPNNESVRDSVIDLINYCALMGERWLLDQPSKSVFKESDIQFNNKEEINRK